MKSVVTGCAGFVGSQVCEELLARGHEVHGIDAFTDYYDVRIKRATQQSLEGQGVRIHEVDLAADDLTQAVDGADLVFHLAAQPGISASTTLATYVRNNVVATNRLLEAAQGVRGLQGFVNVSTSSVYGAHAYSAEDTEAKPISHYGVTKLAAEQLCLALQRGQGFPACSLRLFSVYGPRERPDKLFPRLIQSILRDEEFPLFEGSERHVRSFTYVGDAVRGIVSVADHLEASIGEIINVGSGIEMTTGEAMRIVEDILGKEARVARKPRRPGDQLYTRANIQKASRLLHYKPETSPEVGLRKQVEYLKQAETRTQDTVSA